MLHPGSGFRNRQKHENNLGISGLSLPVAYTEKNAKQCLAMAFSTDLTYDSSLKVRMAPFHCVLGSCGPGTLGAGIFLKYFSSRKVGFKRIVQLGYMIHVLA